MSSSPPFAGPLLELPAVTLADRVAVALVLLAGVIAGSMLLRHAQLLAAAGVLACALVSTGLQVHAWTRSGSPGPLRLERASDGALRLFNPHSARGVAVIVGPRTRVLGPSIVLDLAAAPGEPRTRYRWWLTPLDLPGDALRRLTVVLPVSGHVACS